MAEINKYVNESGIPTISSLTQGEISDFKSNATLSTVTVNGTITPTTENLSAKSTTTGATTAKDIVLSGASTTTYGSSISSSTTTVYDCGYNATSGTQYSYATTPLGGTYTSSTGLVTILSNLAKYCHSHTITTSSCSCDCDYCSCDSDDSDRD